eukprot:2208540-Rhodomonas_salina.1
MRVSSLEALRSTFHATPSPPRVHQSAAAIYRVGPYTPSSNVRNSKSEVAGLVSVIQMADMEWRGVDAVFTDTRFLDLIHSA